MTLTLTHDGSEWIATLTDFPGKPSGKGPTREVAVADLFRSFMLAAGFEPGKLLVTED